MNARVEQLLDEALDLPVDERWALAVALLDSLDGDPDPSIGEAWRSELRARRDQLRAGLVVAAPWLDAKARLQSL